MGIWKRWQESRKLNKLEIDLRSFAVGMNSSVDIPNDLHIIFADYDIDDIRKVRESVLELQQFWNLADAHIFKTKHGFHVFFWNDIMPYGRVKMIIEYAKFVDPMFKLISRYYNHKTIRTCGKYDEKDIKFVEIMKGLRVPSKFEREIGEMKMREHSILRGAEDGQSKGSGGV